MMKRGPPRNTSDFADAVWQIPSIQKRSLTVLVLLHVDIYDEHVLFITIQVR